MSVLDRIKILLSEASAKGFFHLFSANILINLLAFGSQLVVVKFLSPAEMADIKTMQSFVGIAVVLAGFGFNSAVLKLCSEDRDLQERRQIFKKNLVYSLVPIVAVLVLVAVASILGLLSPEENVNRWMLLFMLSIPFTVITSLVMMYLQALKKIKVMAGYQSTIRLVGVALLIFLTYLAGFSGFVIATVTVAAAAMIPLMHLVKGDLRSDSTAANIFQQSWHYARWSLAANLVQTISGVLDIVMLNYLVADRAGLGFYSIATIFILGLNQVTATVQAIATSYFSGYARDESQFKRILHKYQRLLITLALILATVSIFAVPAVVKWFYGPDYADVGLYFQILALKYFLWSCFVLPGVAIWGIGRVDFSFYCAAAGLVISTISTYLLIQEYGILGAAYAQVFTYASLLIIVHIVARVLITKHFRTIGAGA